MSGHLPSQSQLKKVRSAAAGVSLENFGTRFVPIHRDQGIDRYHRRLHSLTARRFNVRGMVMISHLVFNINLLLQSYYYIECVAGCMETFID